MKVQEHGAGSSSGCDLGGQIAVSWRDPSPCGALPRAAGWLWHSGVCVDAVLQEVMLSILTPCPSERMRPMGRLWEQGTSRPRGPEARIC